MHPADAEADSGRAQPVGEREQRRLAAARDHDPVHLDAVDELLEDRLAGRRLGDRLRRGRARPPPRLSTRKTARWPPESTRLEHRREPRRVERGRDRPPSGAHANGGCGNAVARAPRASRLCVMRCAVSRSDPGRPSVLRDRGHDGHRRSAETVRTPSTPCRRPTSITAATSVKSTTSATSAAASPGRLGVPVDRDDAQAPPPCAARSHGADGARRRRRGRSSRAPMLTDAARCYPPYASS